MANALISFADFYSAIGEQKAVPYTQGQTFYTNTLIPE